MDRLIQLGGSGTISNENASFIRSSDREERERAARKPEVTKTRTQILGEQYANAYYAEQAEKLKADTDAIARGTLTLLPNGGRVEKFSGLKRL
jgi:hypothetical protein